ncbi:hypothetical protein [Paraburkholderia dioscoreae]|nr:hypothetical protein [Paraburkholderia dioscoreae]
MTIAELIDYLHAFPANARVVLPHFNSGFDDIVTVYALPIRLGTIQFGSGAHTGPDMFSDIPFEPDETAIVIDFEAATRLAEPVASQPGSAGAPRRRLGTLAG